MGGWGGWGTTLSPDGGSGSNLTSKSPKKGLVWTEAQNLDQTGDGSNLSPKLQKLRTGVSSNSYLWNFKNSKRGWFEVQFKTSKSPTGCWFELKSETSKSPKAGWFELKSENSKSPNRGWFELKSETSKTPNREEVRI